MKLSNGIIAQAEWPVYDEAKCRDEAIEIAVQVNGKIKSKLVISPDAQQDELPDSDSGTLAHCIGLLGDTDREILYLKFELELDYAEIARTLGISVDAARHRVQHARRKLRELLEEGQENE